MKQLIKEILQEYIESIDEQRQVWTEKLLRDLTQQYDDLNDFLTKEKKAAHALRRKGLFDDFTSHMVRKQRKPYTDDELRDITSKYEYISDFKEKEPGAYGAVTRRGLYDELTSHMKRKIVKWTDEMLAQEASRYQTLIDFRDNSESAYVTALNRGILDDITQHMPRTKIWTYDEAEAEARKYEDYQDFYQNSPAFSQSKRNGWVDDFKKFLPVRIENWTKEKVHEIAKKYKTKKEFCDEHPKACAAAYNNKWMDDIDNHFEKLGSKFKRLIYVYEFSDNHAYVGLTFNENRRKVDHLDIEKSNSAVAKHIRKTGLIPNYKTLTEFMSPEDAANLENCTIEKYKSEGWTMLNTQKGGNLGACKRTKLTMEIIRDLASKFPSRVAFKTAHKKEYQIAQKYGWLTDVFKDIPVVDRTKWTYEKTKEESKKYNSRSEFKFGNQSAYNSANKNGWMDEFFPPNSKLTS